MLSIRIPNSYIKERKYIIKVVFKEFLGLKYDVNVNDCNYFVITVKSDLRKKQIILYDGLFSLPERQWLTKESLPYQPLKWWHLNLTDIDCLQESREIPVINGSDPARPDFFQINGDTINLGLDIFGSSFFMLTRYEELVKSDRDEHGRFPASASLAYQEGFLDRPIINEYVEILWWCLQYLWPGLERKKRAFRIRLSHDVDSPFAHAFKPFNKNLMSCAGDIIKRRNIPLATRRFYNWLMVKSGNLEKDLNNQFNFIMDISEKYNLKSTFNFQSLSDSKYDGNYSLDHPHMQYLLKLIFNRGHEIGLHPGYDTIRDSEATKTAFERLLSACDKLGIEQDQWGGRQHFLRWQVPFTWQNYEDAGLDYDTTLSYADHVGFRCGVCYEYPVFNLLTRRELSLRERPLVIMESSLFDKKYMDLDYRESLMYITHLINRCKKFNGDFTLLWHNHRLVETDEVALYQKVLLCHNRNSQK